MKTIGLLWWMSRESSLEYYRIINEEVKSRLGWLHSAEILMHSVNFEEIEKLQHKWDRDALTTIMIANAKRLEVGGAECVVICTNTMHKMAEALQENISIPLLHIADATAKEIQKVWLENIALLWTKFTMEQDFYAWRIRDMFGINLITPDKPWRNEVHRIIYDELCCWVVNRDSKEYYKNLVEQLAKSWAEWVILWCTEIMLLLKQKDVSIPVFDTTTIHAISAVDFVLWENDN